MDILNQIFTAQKKSREQKVQNFNSIFAEDVAVDTAMAKAKQVEEMERLKSNHEKELEALQDKHDRENGRLGDAKEKESIDKQIKSKRDAERKSAEKQRANESVEVITEGTWAVPDSYEKLSYLQKNFLGKKIPATAKSARGVAISLYNIFGSDDLFDELFEYEDNPDTKVDLRNVIIKHLSQWVEVRNYKIGKAPDKWISNTDPLPRQPKVWKEQTEVTEGREKGPRAFINPNKEVMVVKKNKVIVIDKKDQDKYLKQGWILAEDIEEGKLVSDIQHIIDTVMKKINNQVGKEIQKNQEKGLGMLNTLGSFVGHRVTDKKQEKGKLFLKFGESVDEELQEVTDKEVNALKKLSKDMQSVLKGYQSVAKMGDGELKDKKYNKDYEAVLNARDVIFQLIGKVNTQKTLNKEDRNYKKEYENYHSDPEQIRRRAKRNEARRMLKNRKGIKGKDVHHKDNNPMNNDKANLSIVSQNFNRKEPRLRETLSKSASIGEWIKDFEKSDAPQFKGQSADQIKKMAVAAYYANQKGK